MSKKGGRKRDMIDTSRSKRSQVGIPTRGQERQETVRGSSDDQREAGGGLPPPWGSGERMGLSGENRRAAEQFRQPVTPTQRSISQGGLPQPSFLEGGDTEEALPTHYRPVQWPASTQRQKYKRGILENWQRARAKEPRTKIITLVRLPPKGYGQLFGSHTTYWLLSCPACGAVSELSHSVTLLQDAITITPSIECPKCGFHETIMAWQLKRS